MEKGEFSFVALGGLSEVGKNTYCIEVDEKIFIIDAGILFPDETQVGIDYIIPDYSYLQKHESRIVGLFITHGHEDHIGGIPFLVKQVKIPVIYACGIAIDLIKNKITEQDKVPITPIDSTTVLKFDDIKVSFIHLNHSIPDMNGIVITSTIGSIFHSGDFKFDFTPVGPKSDFNKLTRIDNLLCLFSDSTNANNNTLIASESVIGKSLEKIFTQIKGKIIIATFSSNIYRIKQIIDGAVKVNRKVFISGRSMQTAVDASIACRYINCDLSVFVDEVQISKYKDNEILILCTGSQGETNAALSRMADSKHRSLKISKDDTIIFSSNPIPGNQDNINKSIDKIYRLGARVIINSPLFGTHTSGHGSQNDLKLLISLTQPDCFIPIHGERRMLTTHRRLAIDCGIMIDDTALLDNGEMVLINKKGIKHIGRTVAGDVYVDSKKGIGISQETIQERRLLSQEGLYSVICYVDTVQRKVFKTPKVVSRGLLYMNKNQDMTTEVENHCKDLINSMLQTESINWQSIKEALDSYLKDEIYIFTKRRPIIKPILIPIER